MTEDRTIKENLIVQNKGVPDTEPVVKDSLITTEDGKAQILE